MSITLVQQSSNGLSSVASVSKAFGSNTTPGNLLLACVGAWNSTGAGTLSVSDTGGNTWHPITAQKTVGPSAVAWFYAKAVGGASTITASTTASGTDLNLLILEYSGVDTLDQSSVGGGGTNPIASGNITTTQADELLFVFGYNQSHNTTATYTSGFTQQQSLFNPDVETSVSADQVVSVVGTYGCSITWGAGSTTAQYSGIAAFYKASSPPPSTGGVQVIFMY